KPTPAAPRGRHRPQRHIEDQPNDHPEAKPSGPAECSRPNSPVHLPSVEQPAHSDLAGPHAIPSPGPVIIIGGAEDKFRDKAILSRFVEFAEGPDANIVVISTASSLGDRATELYRLLFTDL